MGDMDRIHTIQPGQIYRHFKNKLYQIVTVAEHTETGEKLVVYQALYGDYGIYARPYEMFTSQVDRSKYPVELYPQEDRFVLVGQAGTLQTGGQIPEEPFVLEDIRSKAETQMQAHREEKQSQEQPADSTAQPKSGSQSQGNRPNPQDYLLAFLETDSYQEKLDILRMLGDDCTETILNSMALSLDMALRGATLEDCIEEVRQCLKLHMKYEKTRR